MNELETLGKGSIDAIDIDRINQLKHDINLKKTELDKLTKTKLNGQIIRPKAQIVEHGDKKKTVNTLQV